MHQPFLTYSNSRYIEREFPTNGDETTIYSVPRTFKKSGEKQAIHAEERIFERLQGIGKHVNGVWLTFFHSAVYAGHSFRNQRDGKLMIREHDFVVFAKYQGEYEKMMKQICNSALTQEIN